MVSLLSLPNIIIEMSADNTNIHANEQMKIAELTFEFIQEANIGTDPLRDEVKVERALLVKIW